MANVTCCHNSSLFYASDPQLSADDDDDNEQRTRRRRKGESQKKLKLILSEIDAERISDLAFGEVNQAGALLQAQRKQTLHFVGEESRQEIFISVLLRH